MKFKASRVLVVVAGLGLLGMTGCAEDPGAGMKVDVPKDATKDPMQAQKDMMKGQVGMYGGNKAGSPPGGAAGKGAGGGGAAPKTQP